ncbi:MAG: hypothetical protein BLM47_13755 [Candidatus Reconcilbacillus cellulovorans]|uniref:DUF551 domain-containing protein n=1 Tax=Candidatus Reconcilbacillus cellulovorans TaxID=1906605 RepID=A0A2A6DWW3_9BACL|nr:MAG: hypothetical protein BLM47_13755 [Candidatus Reconcilbacillus cellulovorans]
MTEYLNKQAVLEWLNMECPTAWEIMQAIKSGAFDTDNSEIQRLKKERDEARQKAEDAWKEIEELEDRLLRVSDRWFSVKEPPKNGQRVLIWYRKGKTQDVAESRFANGGYIGFWDSEVTHWMPMPEPPNRDSASG